MLLGNRNAELRKAMREVGGTVERIDNPSMLALPRVRPALFGEDRVVREGAAERPDNRLRGFSVGLRNKIDGLVLRVTLTQLKRRRWMRRAARGTERVPAPLSTPPRREIA
jgi:hypothetical protein